MGEIIWGNTRWQRLVTWAAGGLLGFGSPTIAFYRTGGRPTFAEAWTGRVKVSEQQGKASE